MRDTVISQDEMNRAIDGMAQEIALPSGLRLKVRANARRVVIDKIAEGVYTRETAEEGEKGRPQVGS